VLSENYSTSEAEELIGMVVDGSVVSVQFEMGGEGGLKIAKDEPPCRHFIASVQRVENEVLRDLFQLKPAFTKLPSDTREPAAVSWDLVTHG
jgi:hypothetical protein